MGKGELISRRDSDGVIGAESVVVERGSHPQASKQATRDALRQQIARQGVPQNRGHTPPPVDTDLQPALFDF